MNKNKSKPLDITFVASKLNNVAGGGSNQTMTILANLHHNNGNNVNILTLEPEKNNIRGDPDFNIIEPNHRQLPSRIGNAITVSQILSRYESITDIFQLFHPNYSPAGGLYRKRGGKVPVIGYLNRYTFCTNNCRMDGQCHQKCSSISKFRHSKAHILRRLFKFPLYMYTTHIEPYLMNHVDRFVGIGPRSKEIFEANGVHSDQSTIIPLTTNQNFETQNPKVRSNGVFRVLYVGQLLELKGVDILIDAVDYLDEEIVVDIVGDGSQKSRLEAQVSRLGLEKQINFHGYISHEKVPKYYESADVFVHPSRFPDPGTRTVVEALEKLTPVIVSDSGDPPWAVGEAGLVFQNENAKELAGLIQDLKENDKKLSELQKSCKERRKNFLPCSAQQKFEELYRTVI